MARAFDIPGWLDSVNRFIGAAAVVVGLAMIGVGLFLGAFAWLNDGLAAGAELLLVTSGFGLAFVAIGFSFRVVARAHAARSRWRWWLQALLPVAAAWLAVGLAAEFSVLVGNLAG